MILKRGDPDRGALVLLIAIAGSMSPASSAGSARTALSLAAAGRSGAGARPRKLARLERKSAVVSMKIYG
jgi:hypothetical protein